MSLMNQLTTSLDELEHHLKGEKRLKTTKIATKSIPSYSALDVKKIRIKINLSQKSFADIIGVSSKTVEAWEQGKNRPNGSSARLLQILNHNPEIILREITEEPAKDLSH